MRRWRPPALTETDPGLLDALDALVDPEARSDPMTLLRWTVRSTRNLTEQPTAAGHLVSHHGDGRLLGELGYSLQANAKTMEGAQHPDRDGQFRYIHGKVTACLSDGAPVVRVDANKKELIGDFANKCRTWHRRATCTGSRCTTSPARSARPRPPEFAIRPPTPSG